MPAEQFPGDCGAGSTRAGRGLAFTWKLTSLGIPTVVVYLGFLGDSGIANAGEPFSDEAHCVFADHGSRSVIEYCSRNTMRLVVMEDL